MIDFVTTTPYKEGQCKRFQRSGHNVHVFQEYPVLYSGIEAEVNAFRTTIEDGKKDTKERLTKVEERIDTFVARILTVVAVLFTGLGIVASGGSGELSSVVAPVLIAGVALYFALRAHAATDWYAKLVRWRPEVVITAFVVLVSLMVGFYFDRAKRDQQARSQASEARSALKQQKQDFEGWIRELRQQTETKINSLHQEINLLQQNQVKGK